MTLKTDLKIMQKALVCEESTLRGDITINAGCVIHPSATIIAEAGPIILGENCIVEEYATIVHKLPPGATEQTDPQKSPILTIGCNNVFEIGCVVEAFNKIGDKNVFECRSYVSANVKVSNDCVIGAGCHLNGPMQLKEKSVVFGKDCHTRETIDKHGSHILQLDSLRKILPNYHRLRKPTMDGKKQKI